MTRDEIIEFLGETKQKAGEILVEDGFHAPLAFLFPPAGFHPEPVIISLVQFMADDRTKSVVGQAIRDVVVQLGASGVVTVVEAWISPAAVTQKWGLRPSEDPDRREIIRLTWEFRVPGETEKFTGYWMQFFRREDDKIVLEEVVEESPADEEGRFANLLP